MRACWYALSIVGIKMNVIVSELVNMDWSKVEGARQQRRTIILRESKDKTFLCPVNFCENRQFFSKRGCRKHIDT